MRRKKDDGGMQTMTNATGETPFFNQLLEIQRMQQEAQPWTERHRPDTLDKVVGQSSSVDTLRALMLHDDATFPHLMLSGPAGTGKTTAILAAARELYGRYAVTASGNRPPLTDLVMEINGSDERGIGVVRDRIASFISSGGSLMRSMGLTVKSGSEEAPPSGEQEKSPLHKEESEARQRQAATERKRQNRFLPKLIIIDEADHLTSEAQNALRSDMEKHMDTARFVFIVNYEHMVHKAVRSRCLRLRFAPLPIEDVLTLLKRVCEKENVLLEDGALRAIVHVTRGDMRQALNTLQSCAMHVRGEEALSVHAPNGCREEKQKDDEQIVTARRHSGVTLTAKTVYKITGKPPPEDTARLLRACLQNSANICENVQRLNNYLDHYGVSLQSTLDAMCCLVLRDPANFTDLGFVHEATVAHFLVELERAQRRIVLVTSTARMRVQVSSLAATIYQLKKAEASLIDRE